MCEREERGREGEREETRGEERARGRRPEGKRGREGGDQRGREGEREETRGEEFIPLLVKLRVHTWVCKLGGISIIGATSQHKLQNHGKHAKLPTGTMVVFGSTTLKAMTVSTSQWSSLEIHAP